MIYSKFYGYLRKSIMTHPFAIVPKGPIAPSPLERGGFTEGEVGVCYMKE